MFGGMFPNSCTKKQMPFSLHAVMEPMKLIIFLSFIYHTFPPIFSSHAYAVAEAKTFDIGVLLDDTTRVGKEMKVAIEIAAEGFNETSSHHKLYVHFGKHGKTSLEAAHEAEDLITEKKVMAIIGMQTWRETSIVAEVGYKSRVPVISFSAPAISLPWIRKQWPFFIQMASNATETIQCISEIISTFGWRKVIAIYEVDSYGMDSGISATLYHSLQQIGVEIEHSILLPPRSSEYISQRFVRDEVANLLSKQSRVFIVLQSSMSFAADLFGEAKRLGIMGKDSAWIVADPLASVLYSVNKSVIPIFEGTLGIKTYFAENDSFLDFKYKFQHIFRYKYPEEYNSEIGFYALRAYDCIVAITNTLTRMNNDTINSRLFAQTMLSSSFSGLSGQISFQNGELSQLSTFRIINIDADHGYMQIGFWSSNMGFASSLKTKGKHLGLKTKGEHLEQREKSLRALADCMTWPGDSRMVPKGWNIYNDGRPLKFGVPARTSFEKFVKIEKNSSSNLEKYSGFCIDVFYSVLRILEEKYNYLISYEFFPFNGTYDELVDSVTDKTFDAVIGDITILAARAKHVEFTQPFAESGLTMVVRVRSHSESKAWIFLKPFTKELWAATGIISVYTGIMVWLLERHTNPAFEGRWWNQLNTSLWFTFSSLFFAHRENVQNTYTRVVMAIWLFLVLVLTSSYTASLSSLLTVPHLEPSITDIELLKQNQKTIGCDGDSFVRDYMHDVLGFEHEKIKNIKSEYDYPLVFENGTISAAFLELPYEKAFLNHYCKGYMAAGNATRFTGDRFGGFGFVFQKGSPLAPIFSEAILTLSETGKLKQLEIQYFSSSPRCSGISDKNDRLSWKSFWGLFVFSAATSTICYLLYSIQQLYLLRGNA